VNVADERNIGVDDAALDRAALEALAVAHATPPPPALRERLLRAARKPEPAGPSRRSLVVWRMVGTLAAGIAIALGVQLVRVTRLAETRGVQLAALARARDELQARIDEQGRTLVRMQESLASQATVLQVLSAPQTITAALSATESGTGTARVLADATTGEAAIVVSGLPPAPPGKIYELWAIRGDVPPEPAGLFAVESTAATIARVARVPRVAEVNAFAVSIEPTTGSKSPTGPIVLAGQVTG
jgi:anti-sigma-K factor RskA